MLPTGFGKSITFQILPAVKKSLETSSVSPLVIVVCPLNSIIKDQMNYLRSLGLKAAFVGESAEIDKRVQYMIEVMFAIRKDGFKVLATGNNNIIENS